MDTNLSQPSQAHCHTTVTLACQKFSILHSGQFGKNIKFYDTPPPQPPTLLPMPTLCSKYELLFSRLNIVILKIEEIIIIKYIQNHSKVQFACLQQCTTICFTLRRQFRVSSVSSAYNFFPTVKRIFIEINHFGSRKQL